METIEYDFDASQSSKRNPLQRIITPVVNILTVLILLSALCIGGVFLWIFIEPHASINPFPPPTLPPMPALPSATPTSKVQLPPTWTPTNTLPPTETNTPVPTNTILPTATSFNLPALSATPTFSPTPYIYLYELRAGSPQAIQNIYHPESGCNWMGVGGQALKMNGDPAIGLIVQIGGVLPGVSLPDPLMSLTGVALNYGRAGYEFTLADHPIASRGSLWIQLLNEEGAPLSDKIYFETFDTCDKNLIIIDFIQTREF